MNMTKNPLALIAGVLIMIFGLSLFGFIGYHIFVEEKMYRSANESVMGKVIEKEEQKIFQDALDNSGATENKGNEASEAIPPTTAAATSDVTTKSADATDATTAERPITTNYRLHYSFTPAGATEPVTGVKKVPERLFKSMNENDEFEVLYSKENSKEDHRLLLPYKKGNSFYGGIAALLGGALFIAYLGWCFIFPEE